MTDIVARLRALSPYGGTIGAEAADEIERLTRQVDLFKNTLEATEQTVKMQAEEIERLKALLTEAADDLTSYVSHEHDARNEYPDQMRRYKRDMDLVNRIREALGGD